MKKLLSLFLSLVIMLTFIPFLSYADDDNPSGETASSSEPVVIDESSAVTGENDAELTGDVLPESDPVEFDEQEENAEDVSENDEEQKEPSRSEIIDEFDSLNNLWITYDESDPNGELSHADHYSDGTLSASFKLDGHSVYYIRTLFYDPRTYEDFDELCSETRVLVNNDLDIGYSDGSAFDEVWRSNEMGQEGDLITITLKKDPNFNQAAFFWIEVQRYSSYAETSSLPENYTMVVNDYEEEIDPSFCGDASVFYKADYSISDDSIAELDVVYYIGGVSISVYAKKAGSAVITATLPNGNEYHCNLKVNAGLKYTSKTMYIKQSFTNQVYGATGSVKWSSSNKKIATVSSKGVIKALKKGKVTITAKTGGKTYKCVVTIKNPTISESSICPIVKQKRKLSVKGGSGKIKWSSSNNKIAKVSSSGVVTAKSPGTCTITAKRNGFKTKCKVTVVKKLTLNTTSLDLTMGADGYNEEFDLTVRGGFGEADWSSDNPEIVTVEEGTVTPLQAGSTTIRVNRNGYSAACKVNVESWDNVIYAEPWSWNSMQVSKSMCSSDNSNEDDGGWFIKIRPKTGYITVKSIREDAFIELCDKDGNVISETSLLYEGDSTVFGVKSGNYYYLVVDDVFSSYNNGYSEDPVCTLSISNKTINNKCGYSKKKAKTIKKKSSIQGVHYAGEWKEHWYKIKLTKASKLHIYFNNHISPDAYITVYQGSKVISYGGSDGRCFDYGESDTLSSKGKLKKGTYYIRIDTDGDYYPSGYYTLKWY